MNTLKTFSPRTVPRYVSVLGSAKTNATVTLWSTNSTSLYATTTRKGEYFHGELPLNNSTGAVWLTLTNLAVLQNSSNPDIVTNTIGQTFVAQTPEALYYDLDGNLTNDGRWVYTWDAENRLVRMESSRAAPPPSKLKLEFAYDAKGRRIQKLVSTNNGSGYVAQYTNRFVYDGWNLVGVLSPSSSLLSSFVWGLDLSGSIQGAGGVGGLISMTVHQDANAGTYFYYFDGNHNVATLVNATNGAIAAQYDYASFGELLRATGPLAFVNPFTFSTKFCDWETGFLYYGYRYYDPSTGRWPNRDPLEERGGVNLYGFVRNNPISRFDKLGLFSFVCDKCKKGNIRAVSVTDWGLIPTVSQGNPNTVAAAMSALSGSELIGWVSDIGGVATGMTEAEILKKIAEVAKSIADSGTGHGMSPDSGKIVDAINQIQKLLGQQEGVYIDVQVSWQKCETVTSPNWGGGLPFTSHLDWVGHNNWWINEGAGTSGPAGGFDPNDTSGIMNALASSFAAALQNTSY